MQFGKKLLSLRYKPWAAYYLDYQQLKEILEREDHETQPVQTISTATLPALEAADNVSLDVSMTSRWTTQSYKRDPVTNAFMAALHLQMEKILLFVLQEQGHIAVELADCRSQMWQAQTDEAYSTLYEDYLQVGQHLLRLLHFVDLNVTGLRKIVKKHDKCMTTKISGHFWAKQHSRLRGSRLVEPLLLQDESMGALAIILETGLEDLRCRWNQHHQEELLLRTAPQTLRKEHARRISAPLIPTIITPHAEDDGEECAAAVLEEAHAPITPRSTNVMSSRPPVGRLSPVRRRSVLALTSTNNSTCSMPPEPILVQIHAARKRLQQTNEFAQLLAAPLMVTGTPPETVADETTEEPFSSPVSNFLNLLSTALYMTNYYIVAPTSASYSQKLGGDPAAAAMIIGMTPIAALVSTVLFSWWTSHSYKAALLFASTCSLLGNLLYALGLPADSLELVLLGRLLNGFGSARSINRRYIADTFAWEQRTAASALFVTAGALGMAAGPAVASLLHLVVVAAPTSGNDDEYQPNLYWQVENAPGWFMLVLWAGYLVCLIVCFRDPPQKKRQNVEVEMTGEQKPLLSSSTANHNKMEEEIPMEVTISDRSTTSKKSSLWGNIPVMTTFLIYFVLKLVLEAVLSSSANLTGFYFGWDGSVAGAYLASMGLLMLPANLVVSYAAQQFEDRELIVAIQAVMLVGCLGILNYGTHYSLAQYVVASCVLFISANALEGPNMSLLSKTIPSSWSRGIFNVGLLATEAGTLGRAVADVVLSVCGRGGLEKLLNRTFGSFSLLSGATLGLSFWLYDYLDPIDKDD